MRLWQLAAIFMAVASVCPIARTTDKKDTAEASMLVTGTVQVLTDGSVGNITIDKADTLPAPVVDLVKRNATTWKFELKNPSAAPLEETMSVRIVARNSDDQHMTLSLTGAAFSDKSQPEAETIQWAHRLTPSYPDLSLNNGITGTVYVILRVGRDGKVINAATEQVNLRRLVPNPRAMDVYRKDLAHAALRTAKYWTFKTPTTGIEAQAPFWDVRVPVSFGEDIDQHAKRQAGAWEVYVPGPREHIPWLDSGSTFADAPDATPDGGIHPLHNRAQLLAPPTPN